MVIAGLFVTEDPEAIKKPPQEPEYHIQFASSPRLPPVIPSVVLAPEHTGDVPVADIASEDKELTVIIVLTHEVVLHVPSALTQYVVVNSGETESEAPEISKVPPQNPEYHIHLAPEPRTPPDSVIVRVVPLHIVVAG